MKSAKLFLLFSILFFVQRSAAQDDDGMIRTTDGHAIASKSSFLVECKRMYGSSSNDSLVTKACECQANLLNNYFTNHQLSFYQQRYKEKALQVLIDQDPVIQKKLRECSTPVTHLQLVSTPGSRKLVIKQCVENLKNQTIKPVNDTQAIKYCNCAVDIMQKRKITAERINEVTDPSSFLFNEIAYQCGSPFLKSSDYAREWKVADSADIAGPLTIDTVKIISVLGMHKVKITIGGITKIWLIDSGASDLLVSDDYAKELKGSGILREENYLGEGEYSLADNSIITCQRYKISGVKIGRFLLNNVVLASSKSAKEFLLGKSLLNKFRQWSLDNQNDLLILTK